MATPHDKHDLSYIKFTTIRVYIFLRGSFGSLKGTFDEINFFFGGSSIVDLFCA